MLTQNELEWLAERDKGFFYSCRYCPGRDKQTEKSLHECMSFCWDNNILAPCAATTHELRFFQDAAEFEQRVAAKLVNLAYQFAEWLGDGSISSCDEICPASLENHGICETNLPCKACMLKHARLQVEEEMDA